MSEQMPARIWCDDIDASLCKEKVKRSHTSYVRADLAERMAEALEASAARFNLMIGVGIVNGIDPRVGYREAMAALSAFRSSTQDTEARHE